MWDNTIIVLTGDHGQAFYEHGFASHASAIFDEVMKVPSDPRSPTQTRNRGSSRIHVDIAPSIVGLLGLPAHPSFQGIDLLNTAPDPKRSAYMVGPDPAGLPVWNCQVRPEIDLRRTSKQVFAL